MARALNLDLLQVFNFSLRDVTGAGLFGGSDVFSYGGGEDGGIGFAGVGAMEVTAETEQFYEGNWPFPRTVIRRASVSPITLRRGIAPRDSDFYLWFHSAVFGDVNTRKNLLLTMNRRDGRPAKAWLLHECIPTRLTIAPELDALTEDIAIAEIDVTPNFIEELELAEEDA